MTRWDDGIHKGISTDIQGLLSSSAKEDIWREGFMIYEALCMAAKITWGP
jgi:hypothetical protein